MKRSSVVLGMIGLAVLSSAASAGYMTTPADQIIGVAAAPGATLSSLAVVGTTAGANNYPAAEAPNFVIDENLGTKYLNFRKTNVGVIIKPTGSEALASFRFGSANDAPERDPLTVVIEGMTGVADPLIGALNTSWTQIYSGSAGLDTDPGRGAWGAWMPVNASQSFSIYRILITNVRTAASANSVQFSEIQLYGVPEPASLLLMGLAIPVLRARRRKA